MPRDGSGLRTTRTRGSAISLATPKSASGAVTTTSVWTPPSSNDRSVRSTRKAPRSVARSVAPPNRSPLPAAGTIATAPIVLLLFQRVGDPALDFFAQHPQRQRSVFQHHIVEISDIELVAELLLRLVAETTDFEIADHVGGRLSRHGDVAIDFRFGAGLRLRRVRAHVVDR